MAKKVGTVILILLLLTVSLFIVGGYRMGIFGDKKKTYTFKEYFEKLDNPYMGYAPEADNEKLCAISQLVYMNLFWSELEPEEGHYNWDAIEDYNHLDRWRSEGKHLVLRFICDYPTKEEHMDIPQWLYEKTMDGQFYDIEYGKGYCPNYDNETFIEEHAKVIEEIGRHFSEDDFLSYVELGSLGHWGEWHTYYPAGIPRIPKTEIRAKYVEAYEEAFPNAKLLMRRPFAERPEGCGVFNDMTGASHDTFVWLSWIDSGGEYDSSGEKNAIVAAPEIWKNAPVGGEFTSSIPLSIMLGKDYEETRNMIEKSHMTFIGPKVPNPIKNPDIEENTNNLLAYVGYRYRISDLTLYTPFLSKETIVSATIVNDGVAPIYFPRRACLYIELPKGADPGSYLDIADGYGKAGTEAEEMLRFEMDVDITGLSQGEEKTCSIKLPKEVLDIKGVKIYAGIENPNTGEIDVLLSMKEDRKGNLTLLHK